MGSPFHPPRTQEGIQSLKSVTPTGLFFDLGSFETYKCSPKKIRSSCGGAERRSAAKEPKTKKNNKCFSDVSGEWSRSPAP